LQLGTKTWRHCDERQGGRPNFGLEKGDHGCGDVSGSHEKWGGWMEREGGGEQCAGKESLFDNIVDCMIRAIVMAFSFPKGFRA